MSTPRSSSVVWGLSLRDRLVIALVGALIVAAKFYLRIPIRVPGHSGLFWMALLIIGTGAVGKRGAGTLIGLVSAVLASIFLPGSEGPLVGIKYFVPGLLTDVLTPLLGGRLDSPLTATVVGAAANMSKLAASYLIGRAMGISAGYLALGLGVSAVTHLVFGGLGGLAGSLVLGRLRRAGVAAPAPSAGSAVPARLEDAS
ncbi:MAG TPA: hypothetical protein VFG89_05935 [Coriobacteriia bacterium]|nr:hypothetical protein [Coriobacteriia bacterium]